jgi:hypothetical protein
MFTLNKRVQQMIRGKSIIGLGARRIVYDLGNGYVLKVAKSIYGVANNKREAAIYRGSPPKVRKHLGRIQKQEDDCSWLIMEKYPFECRNTRENRRKLADMRALFRRNGIVPYDIFDRHRPNCQNLRLDANGNLVVIDYGNFKNRR